ncbi:hypothetical protein STEG23_027208, partial [Scotinomys teguina]
MEEMGSEASEGLEQLANSYLVRNSKDPTFPPLSPLSSVYSGQLLGPYPPPQSYTYLDLFFKASIILLKVYVLDIIWIIIFGISTELCGSHQENCFYKHLEVVGLMLI